SSTRSNFVCKLMGTLAISSRKSVPEAWQTGVTNIRAPYYMRANAIWAVKHAYDIAPAPCGLLTCTPTPTFSPTVTQTPTATVNPCAAVYQALNCGGTATVIDGVSWAADKAYTAGGFGYVTAGTTATTGTAITGSGAQQAIYQTERYAATLEYKFTVPNGLYQVTLKNVEQYWTSAGSRVFNVALNGVTVLNNLDIYAQVGEFAADDHSFAVSVTGGVIDIVETASADNAELTGVEITSESPCSPTPTGSPTRTSTATPSPSPTWMVTATQTATPTLTASATSSTTPTLTATDSPIATSTFSATPTPSETFSPTLTETPSVTLSPVFSFTPTSTPSNTGTATATVTASSTSSSTPTLTPSVTLTPVFTSTDTPTPTATLVFTTTRTPTSTVTWTPSPTPSETLTLTATASVTPTWTADPTATVTVTPTVPRTNTPTPPFSPTPTSTLFWTPTPIFSPTPVSSPGSTGISSPYPNPTSGGPVTVQLRLSGSYVVHWDIFTTAFRKIAGDSSASLPGGFLTWNLKDSEGQGVANGIYYWRVQVKDAVGKRVRILKVLLIR
ncbi:MAG: malectin domain-containing carbohydrate-binding protein, partial [bacterium]